MGMWSNGAKCAICLSYDFDAESLWFETFDQQTPSPLSRGEYGGRVGIYKVHDLMTKHKIPCTYFIPAWVALNYPKECQMVAKAGNEIGYHGFYHESVKKLRIDRERDLMKRGMAILTEVTGYTPRGNRSVPFDMGPNTAKLLQEMDFIYDTSMMGADNPYFIKVDGKGSDIVELPVSWELDDAPFFIFSYFPYMSGLWPPSTVYEIWSQEFEGAYREGGLFLLTMHPQIIGRRSRLIMLEKLINDIRRRPGIWWARHIDVALDWLKTHGKGRRAAAARRAKK